MMNFEEYAAYQRFRDAWDAVKIVRAMPYTLFTFGDTDLPYYLVCTSSKQTPKISVRRGDVKISRPLIITPDNAAPDFRSMFDGDEDEGVVKFVLARSAKVKNMNFSNVVTSEKFVSDSEEEVVDRIKRQLDAEEEDRVGVLTAPAELGAVAVLRYCLERVADSAEDNLSELKERGFLPDFLP